jgi:hypothetical protein
MTIDERIKELARDIIHHKDDAKPLAQSNSLWMFVVMAAGWASHNLAAYFDMGQSLEVTVYVGLLGATMLSLSMVITMVRPGIKVPPWIVRACQAVLRSES